MPRLAKDYALVPALVVSLGGGRLGGYGFGPLRGKVLFARGPSFAAIEYAKLSRSRARTMPGVRVDRRSL